MMKNKPRKKRSDRNYVIYKLTCNTTGDQYIGVVVAEGRAFTRSVKNRFKAHTRNALQYGKVTRIADAIRESGPDAFTREVVTIIRGKKEAHACELAMIKEMRPELNMEGLGRKAIA
tara:strand:+ start:13532 stop:13882 length:351 start_codon:yes stop_codon:yes gene_type:complete